MADEINYQDIYVRLGSHVLARKELQRLRAQQQRDNVEKGIVQEQARHTQQRDRRHMSRLHTTGDGDAGCGWGLFFFFASSRSELSPKNKRGFCNAKTAA